MYNAYTTSSSNNNNNNTQPRHVYEQSVRNGLKLTYKTTICVIVFIVYTIYFHGARVSLTLLALAV